MSYRKIYIASIIIFAFAIFGFISYRCNKEDILANIKKDIAKEKEHIKIDTVYQKTIAVNTVHINIEQIKDYIIDTILPAIADNSTVKTEEVFIPVYIDKFDSVRYYKRIADSFRIECDIYKAKYANIIFHPPQEARFNTKDSATKSDSAIDLYVKNRWEYNKIFGLPIRRTGYTDIYGSDNKRLYTIKQGQTKFGMRLQGISTFSQGSLKSGLALRADGRGLQGSVIYYYNFQTMKFYPAISINADILRIH